MARVYISIVQFTVFIHAARGIKRILTHVAQKDANLSIVFFSVHIVCTCSSAWVIQF